MRTLVTGFGPFLNVVENPSATLARRSGNPYQVLEVSYEGADAFLEALDPDSFDRWLMLGVATERVEVSIEAQAKNHRSGRDVRGNQISGVIDFDQPGVLKSTLWDASLAAKVCEEFREELYVSHDAGSFLCNYLSFRALGRFPEKKIGFLHVVRAITINLDRQLELVTEILKRFDTAPVQV